MTLTLPATGATTAPAMTVEPPTRATVVPAATVGGTWEKSGYPLPSGRARTGATRGPATGS